MSAWLHQLLGSGVGLLLRSWVTWVLGVQPRGAYLGSDATSAPWSNWAQHTAVCLTLSVHLPLPPPTPEWLSRQLSGLLGALGFSLSSSGWERPLLLAFRHCPQGRVTAEAGAAGLGVLSQACFTALPRPLMASVTLPLPMAASERS